MSRRKQSKPQHINSEEPGSAEPGALQDASREDGNEIKRCRMEETRVCEKCCAEFFDETEFLEHERNCTKSQQVVIMKDGEGGEVPLEFSQCSPGFQSDHSDGRSSSNSQSKHSIESADTNEDALNLNTDGDAKQSQEDMSNNLDIGYMGAASKLQETNVTLEAMPATRVAVTQHSSSSSTQKSPPPTSQDALHAIPMILEQLVSLQQQQLQQIQLTEQIRIQVAMMTPQGLQSAMGATVDPLKALGAHLSQQLSAAAALIGKRTSTQSLSLEALKQGKLPQSNSIPTSLAGSASSIPLKTDTIKGLPDLANRLPALLPQSPSVMAFQSPFTNLAANLDPSKKCKNKIHSIVELKNGGGEQMYKHKCKFCGKTFGNDSALQIHLRSHTGERPFKCNICGNRFTTKGNLKVHFQRHKDKYPHIKMNPHPVPEHLDNIPTNNGIPYGMSVPIEESNVVDNKPVIGLPSTGVHSSVLQGFKPSFDVPVTSELYTQRPSSSGSDGASISSGMFNNEVGMDQGKEASDALGSLHQVNSNSVLGENASGTAKLQQMVDGLEKRTNDPNECLICHRILSCQSSLKMHYRTHTGERPYKCKICGRAFSTKGNLKAHYGVHRANTPLKMQHSCPICQKKFTNAVVLQQHIRMHMGGQIPNTPLPESQYEGPEMMDSSLTEKNMDASGLEESMEEQDVDFDNQENPNSSEPPPTHTTKADQPLSGSPAVFTGISALENHMKSLTSSLNLQRQSSTASESDGGPKESPYRAGELEYKNGHSPVVSDSASFHSSPVDGQLENGQAKSPESVNPDDSAGGSGRTESDGTQDFGETNGALDLTSGFGAKAIKEEPGLSFSNGEYSGGHMPFMRVPPSLVKLEMPIPSENPIGANNQHGSQPFQVTGTPPPSSSAPRRSAKQHLCNVCGKNFSSASALQIHERTHTGEKPFACTICGRAFTTKGNLKVHVGTHMWNNSARRGQRLSLDNPMALMAMGAESKMIPDMLQPPKDLISSQMNFDPSVWNQYTAAFSNGLAMKTNEISVIQNGGIPLPGSLAGGPLVGSTGGLMKMDSHSGIPGTVAEMEKNGSESVVKSQFPHFMEEGKVN